MNSLFSLGFSEWAPLLGLLSLLGMVAGFTAGLLGVGGGLVIVPGLFFIFTKLGFESENLMHVCVGTSLAVIIFTGFSSARAHWLRGAVDVVLVKRIGPGIIAGVVFATVLAEFLPGEVMKKIFVVAVCILALIMMMNPSRFRFLDQEPGQPWSAIAGFVTGSVATLVGIGGGTLSVPYMSLCKVPLHRAIGTAAALGLIIAVPAALGFIMIGWGAEGRPPWSVGFANVPAWLAIVPFSISTARVGAWAAHKMPVELLRRVFAVFMIAIAIKMAMELR